MFSLFHCRNEAQLWKNCNMLAKNIKQLLTKVEIDIIQMHWTDDNHYAEDAQYQMKRENGGRQKTI
jgi:hypothetical protein